MMLSLLMLCATLLQTSGLAQMVDYGQAWFKRTGGGGLCRVGRVQQSLIGYSRIDCGILALKELGSSAAFDYNSVTQNCSLLSSREGFHYQVKNCDNYQISNNSELETLATTFTTASLITENKLICSVNVSGENFGCRAFIDNNPKTELISSDVFSLSALIHSSNYNLSDPLFGWIIICQRLSQWPNLTSLWDQGLDFNRTWTDYKQGFGTVTWWLSDFWIGLEAIHKLTTLTNGLPAEFSLRVEVRSVTDSKWYYAEYGLFWVDCEATRYTVYVSGYNGTAGDALTAYMLSIMDGMQFSTIDRDNDKYTGGNCAGERSAGWWYNQCTWAALTSMNSSLYIWKTTNGIMPISASRMFVRRRF